MREEPSNNAGDPAFSDWLGSPFLSPQMQQRTLIINRPFRACAPSSQHPMAASTKFGIGSPRLLLEQIGLLRGAYYENYAGPGIPMLFPILQ